MRAGKKGRSRTLSDCSVLERVDDVSLERCGHVDGSDHSELGASSSGTSGMMLDEEAVDSAGDRAGEERFETTRESGAA